MFCDFIFFGHSYSADFYPDIPIIKLSHKSQIQPLITAFKKSETFRNHKAVTFDINGEKVTVDFERDI